MIGQKSIKSFFLPTNKKRDFHELTGSEDACDVSERSDVAMVTYELETY